MKKNNLILLVFVLILTSCKHEQALLDVEYFNKDAFDKIAEYWNGYTPSSHSALSIYFEKDTVGREQLVCAAHINYNHTLDSMRLNGGKFEKLTKHFGSFYQKTTLSRDIDQKVSFEIRSTTPQNEIMMGEVTIPKPMPITATDLGNNTFKIKWTAQNRGQRVLLHLTYFRVYVTRLNNAYAVETDDDGEFILTPSVFDKFREITTRPQVAGATEPVKVGLVRMMPQRKAVVKQLSTGLEYGVYGGSEDLINIDVLIN
jgi:hypothetical protein